MPHIIVGYLAKGNVIVVKPYPDKSHEIVVAFWDTSSPAHMIIYRLLHYYGKPLRRIDPDEAGFTVPEMIEMAEVVDVPERVLDIIVKLGEMGKWFRDYLVFKMPLNDLEELVNKAYKLYLVEKAITT